MFYSLVFVTANSPVIWVGRQVPVHVLLVLLKSPVLIRGHCLHTDVCSYRENKQCEYLHGLDWGLKSNKTCRYAKIYKYMYLQRHLLYAPPAQFGFTDATHWSWFQQDLIFSSVCTEPADACGVCTHCIKQNNRDDAGTGIHQDESDILDGITYVMAVVNVGTLSFIESVSNAKSKGILIIKI